MLLVKDRVRVMRDLVNRDGGTYGTVVEINGYCLHGNQIRVCWDNMAQWPDGRMRTYTYSEHLLVKV